MVLALPVAIGLVLGKLTGGSFRSLATTPLRYAWLFVLGFAVNVVLFNPMTSKSGWDLEYGSKIYVASLVLLGIALFLNLRRLSWPIYILTAGALLNIAVICSNGGAMPVDRGLLAKAWSPSYAAQLSEHRFINNVQVANSNTRLAALEDRFLISLPISSNVYSIGDIFIGAGGLLLVFTEMHRRKYALPAEEGANRSLAGHGAAGIRSDGSNRGEIRQYKGEGA